jgi:GAF domain-containing protein
VEAVELDEAQYRTGQGPCVDSADPDGPAYALSNDLAGETAWPDFAAIATRHGYGSVLSTALLTGPEPVPFTGALNVYSREPGAFDDAARDLAFILATHASLALDTARARQALAAAGDTVTNLGNAVEGRTIIGQATGILMARRGLTAAQAFDVLKRASQNRNIKLVGLAAALTAEPAAADRL